jgi:hypothetical protein
MSRQRYSGIIKTNWYESVMRAMVMKRVVDLKATETPLKLVELPVPVP